MRTVTTSKTAARAEEFVRNRKKEKVSLPARKNEKISYRKMLGLQINAGPSAKKQDSEHVAAVLFMGLPHAPPKSQ